MVCITATLVLTHSGKMSSKTRRESLLVCEKKNSKNLITDLPILFQPQHSLLLQLLQEPEGHKPPLQLHPIPAREELSGSRPCLPPTTPLQCLICSHLSTGQGIDQF